MRYSNSYPRKTLSKFSYRNEAAFSKAVVSHLRKRGWFVQRIESGVTGKGIPDLYCIGPGNKALWIELKRVHAEVYPSNHVTIPWRPGQLAWHMEVSIRKQAVITLACFDNVILSIPAGIYKNNMVRVSDCTLYYSLNEI